MKLFIFSTLFILSFNVGFGQTLITDPTFPNADESVTFTFDLTGSSLENYSDDLWVWTWIETGCNSNCDAPTNQNPATASEDAAKLTRDGSDPNIYTITFTPTEFFNKPKDEFEVLGILVKGKDWSNGQTKDFDVPMNTNTFSMTLTKPLISPLFLDQNEVFEIVANTSEAADINIKIDGAIVASVMASTVLSHMVAAASPGTYKVVVTADNGKESIQEVFYYVVRTMTIEQSRTTGIVDGINYDPSDPGKVTLSLWAPLKSSVYVVGDFNNWIPSTDYQMYKDGEHFWIEITGLTEGEEYAFQYIVDETIKVADPYADKILDPDDQYIPNSIYANLKAYPSKALSSKWYENRLAVIQTGQTPYNWQVNSFERPKKEDLIIYELLMRDFFGPDQHSYQNLSDTLSYLSGLGINAIELMPIQEFGGNESWGYNPTFMFAPDKYYGTKNALKDFIDEAHSYGIAVILDITMNHHDIPNPYLSMYYDYPNFKPTADNPWFNVIATHPYNVFSDFNHESTYTQKYLDTITYYWVNEFKVDGYRFDLSKGFTQTESDGNVSLWSSKDDSRISILKRMADKIWSHSPDTYIILEHFADNAEEKILSDHGMMLWGNMNHAYSQSSMGYAGGSDISDVFHGNRNWTNPNLVGYMESHDEERLVYKNLEYGNSRSEYSTRELDVALERMKQSATFFYLIPGPKMIWEFGEIGYDQPINLCDDFTTIKDDCRTSKKPIPWSNVDGFEYEKDSKRNDLKNYVTSLLDFRKTNKVFVSNDVVFNDNGLAKSVIIKNNPYVEVPSNADEMNIVLAGNFDVEDKIVETIFPHIGMWFDQITQKSYDINNTNQLINMKAGEYRIYTDVQDQLINIITEASGEIDSDVYLFPNPGNGLFFIKSNSQYTKIELKDLKGQTVYSGPIVNDQIDVSGLRNGIYIYTLINSGKIKNGRLIKY